MHLISTIVVTEFLVVLPRVQDSLEVYTASTVPSTEKGKGVHKLSNISNTLHIIHYKRWMLTMDTNKIDFGILCRITKRVHINVTLYSTSEIYIHKLI